MNNLKNLTVLIVTYKTNKKILLNCLKSIDKRVKILIVENSKNFKYSNITKKFKNLNYICSNKNLGYGNGNNFGLKKINTKYVLILNPDTICKKIFLKMFHL
jgi:N-acetylglucosaminyl-diphospho-decaprenol L-rhamnosyltransferase